MLRSIPPFALSGRRHRAQGGDAGAGWRSPLSVGHQVEAIPTTKSNARPQNRPRRVFGAAWRRLPVDRPPAGGVGSVGSVGGVGFVAELSGGFGASDGAAASFGPAAAPPSGPTSAVARTSLATTSDVAADCPARSLGGRQSLVRMASVSAARRRSTAPSVTEAAASSDPPLGSPFTAPPRLRVGSSGTTFHQWLTGPGHG
jgi:hypothetical protein